MIGRRRATGLGALVLSFSLIAAACGSDDSETSEGATTTGAGTEESTAPATTAGGGGTITIGAEQEPDCMDWIASCAGSSWGSWMAGYQTMPRAYDFVKEGEGWVYKPSILLAGEPEVTAGAKPVVTYKLNPKAVWSDKTPITCKDFIYTWEQIAKGEDIYDPTGYTDIESVVATDDTTCVTTFAKPYAGWKALFGGRLRRPSRPPARWQGPRNAS